VEEKKKSFGRSLCGRVLQFCIPGIVLLGLSFISHHAGAAIAVVEIVTESHHAAGARVITAA